MKEMTAQDKQRIDRSAELYSDRVVVQHIYIDGATFEHQRMAELLKEERNKAIDECIEALSSYRDIDRTQMKEVLESLKGKSQ